MERKIYTTPRTKLFSVELEGTFASSATGTEVANGEISTTGHQLNDINGFDENGNAASWNDGGWE